MFRTWVQHLFNQANSTKSSKGFRLPRRRSAWLCLEPLEDRLVPAIYAVTADLHMKPLPAVGGQPATGATQVAFVESSLPQAATLLDGLAPRTDGVLLDAGGDGLREMAAFLAGRHGLTAIDVVAHGQSGAINLGTTTLDEATLAGAKPELAVLAAALDGQGSLDLWSCDVAAGSSGRTFVNDLAAATGGNVAAASHLVGATALGGSWQLDDRVGNATAASPFTAATQQMFAGVLAAEQNGDNGTASAENTSPTISTVSTASFTYGTFDSLTVVTLTDSPVPAATTFTASNLPSWASLNSTTGALSGTPSATTSTPLSITVTASNGVAPNATGTFQLVVNPAALTVSADAQFTVYGQADPTLTAGYSGFVNGDTASSLSGTLSLTTTATASSAAGTYPITAGGLSSANYNITFENGTLTVNPAPLTITADNQSTLYGEADPTLTAGYSGFVNGDTASTLSGTLSLTTTATASSAAGTYPITPSGLSSANYDITFENGTLTVNPAPLTITADNLSKVYGQANPTLTVSYDGFVPGEGPANLAGVLSVATAATTSSPVGPYTVTPSGLTSGNYAITFVNGTLAITPAPLTVLVGDQSRVYGQANPTFASAYVGFVNGDTAASLTGTLSLTTTANATSDAGTYAITASGVSSSNYSISVDGTLTVTPAPLIVSADAKFNFYGQANPTLTASYSGFVNGDSARSLTGTLSLATTATAGSGAGTYPITVSGLNSANYSITFLNGTLSVIPAPLTVKADDQTRVYGQANPTFTASYSGFVNDDSASSLTGTQSLGTAATAGSGAGAYAITVSGLSSNNYSITFVGGTLTVNPAPLTISADPKSKVYGQANPALTASYTGFVNGDSANSLTGTLTLNTTATTGSGAGVYAITASGVGSSNYSIAFLTGTLFVIPAPLTVMADDQTRAYGQANPTFTASYNGFVNADSAASLGGSLSFATTATTGSSPGNYAITPSGVTATNYGLYFVNGRLTVTPASQTITFAPLTALTFGTAPLTLAATASSGLPVAYQVLSGPGTISGNALTVTAAGSIVIEADQAGNANFKAAAPVRQSLTVYPAGTYGFTPQLNGSTVATTVVTEVGSLRVVSDVIQGMGAGVNLAGVSLTSPSQLSNVSVKAAVNLNTGTSVGLLARYGGSGDSNCYRGELILVNGQPTLSIYRNLNGTPLLLASKTVTATSGTLEFEMVGPSLKLFLGGTLQVFAYDTKLTAGSVAVRMQGAGSVSSVAVNAITPASANVNFSDTFGAGSPAGPPSDGAQLNHVWTEQAGDFTLSGHAAVGTASGAGVATVNLPAPLAAATVSATVNLNTGTSAGLLARYNGSGDSNYYLGELVLINKVKTLAIYRNVNGTMKLLGSRAVSASSGNLRFVVSGTSLQLFFNGVLEVSAVDGTFTTGKIGMRTTGAASVSNFAG